MKKNDIYKLMLAGAFVLLLAACEKQVSPVEPENDDAPVVRTEKVSVKTESDTKVTLVGTTFAWEDGDEIAVWTGTADNTGSYQDCEVTDGKITVTLTDGASRRNYAIYPASVKDASNYGQGTLNVKLPASYSYADIRDNKTPLPMVAVNDSDDLTFYNVAGLLRITVKAIPSDATGLVFQFPGKKVNGTFTVTNPGTTEPSIATASPETTGEEKITVSFPAKTYTELTLNIPLPTGVYEDVFITPVGSATKVGSARHIKAGGYTAARAHGRQLTATLVSFTVAAGTPGKKVIFAPGNLQAIIASYDDETKLATASSWKFADTQYSTVVDLGPEDKSFTMSFAAGKTVDLFSYQGVSSEKSAFYGLCTVYSSSSPTEAQISACKAYYGNNDEEGLKADWGTLAIGSYATNTWATPSSPEFNYLFTERTGASTVGTTENALWAKVSICDHYGLLIFPDVYTHPEGVTVPNAINRSLANWEAVTNYDSSAWTKIEAAGAVFLPVGGQRSSTNVTVGSTAGVNKVGFYMTSTSTTKNSTTSEGKFKGLRFQGQDVNTNFDGSNGNKRHTGGSVRLYHVL
ncbi:MAG: hypothetical protein IJP81_00350 [Bacteroidales bacterium]|nr:hypothetical protein [Bacteroidales bacterium]